MTKASNDRNGTGNHANEDGLEPEILLEDGIVLIPYSAEVEEPQSAAEEKRQRRVHEENRDWAAAFHAEMKREITTK